MNVRNMLLTVGLCAGFLLAPSLSPAQQRPGDLPVSDALVGTTIDPATGDRVITGVIMVKLREGASVAEARDIVAVLASRAGLTSVRANNLRFLDVPLEKSVEARILALPAPARARAERAEAELGRIIELRYAAAITPAEAARRMSRFAEVEYAEPIPAGDAVLAPFVPNDPFIPQQPHLRKIKAFEAWEIWKGDTNTVIGIVDQGVDQKHEDLYSNIKRNWGEFGVDGQGNEKENNGIDDDGNGVIDDFIGANLTHTRDGTMPGVTKAQAHGTTVAGMAAARTNNDTGVAGTGFMCPFFPVKAAHFGTGALIAQYDGILYCGRRGFKVVNCSWGGSFSLARQDIVENAAAAYDIVIVAAAGNTNAYGIQYPSAFAGVFAVGAVDTADVFWTTWGEHVDIAAPVGLGTEQGIGYWPADIATSYSAPVVAGGVALVRSRWPELTAPQAIAHTRLTADPINDANPGKERLIGFGRLNLYRAISTDPFSHPAIVVDTFWTTAPDGSERPAFTVGESGLFRLRLKNILGDASNVRITISAYNEDSTAVTIEKRTLTIDELKRDQTITLPEGIGFDLVRPARGRVRVRIDIAADGGYDDYSYEKVLIYRPYITVTTPSILVSLTDRGHIGSDHNIDSEIGEGFLYKGSPFLFEGGFIVASSVDRIVNNLRAEKVNEPDEDFTAIDFPSPSNNNTLTLSDAPAPENRRVGIELRVRMLTDENYPSAIAMQVRAKNVGAATIDTLRLGFFADWDIDARGDQHSISYVARPGNIVPFHGVLSTPLSGNVITSGVAAPVASPIFFAIANEAEPVVIYDGFDLVEKYRTVGNGIGQRQVGPTDISLVTGEAFASLAPGAEDTALFVIAISNSPEAAAGFMSNFATRLLTSGVDNETDGHATGRISAVRPNPFGSRTTFTVDAGRRGSTLRIFDAYGRQVADLTAQLPAETAPIPVTFDATGLPAGIYWIRLTTGGQVETRTAVVVR